jgi:hypothetical protein
MPNALDMLPFDQLRRSRSLIALAVLVATLGLTAARASGVGPPTIVSETKLRAAEFHSVACPSTTLCVGVAKFGTEATFDPTVHYPKIEAGVNLPLGIAQYATIDGGENRVEGVACPSIAQCTAIDGQGREVTFDPEAPISPTPVALNLPPFSLHSIACPSRTQCTALGEYGEVTFNPISPAPAHPVVIGSAHIVGIDLACPSVTQCTAVGHEGSETTFNPTAPRVGNPVLVDRNTEYSGATHVASLVAVACPTRTECTAVEEKGGEVTFNPISPGKPVRASLQYYPQSGVVACRSATQCTVVEEFNLFTVDPVAPGIPTPSRWQAHNAGWLVSVACPSISQCTAVSNGAEEVTFNPNPQPARTGKSRRVWTRAQCNRAYRVWARNHRHSTRRQQRSEVTTLHRRHGCALSHP